MSYTYKQIQQHYRGESIKHGLSGTSTIQDPKTRYLEMNAIFSYIKNGQKILEVGCGNGYAAREIVQKFRVTLDAIDFSPDLINLAQKQKIVRPKGKVRFLKRDILQINYRDTFDLIFTERCLQNLTSWEDQKTALTNIVLALKPNGVLIMLESFWTGLNKLNQARSELDLPEIKAPWHNLLFDEAKTIKFMARLGAKYIDQNPFLSGYYFGSRIILPAILPKKKAVSSSSVLNDYFCGLPPVSDFCPMKIVRFLKT